jgi:hypothetical protein
MAVQAEELLQGSVPHPYNGQWVCLVTMCCQPCPFPHMRLWAVRNHAAAQTPVEQAKDSSTGHGLGLPINRHRSFVLGARYGHVASTAYTLSMRVRLQLCADRRFPPRQARGRDWFG